MGVRGTVKGFEIPLEIQLRVGRRAKPYGKRER